MSQYTLTIIKPTAVKMGYYGNIISEIVEAGFKITAMKMVHLDKEQASQFYAIHRNRPFFDDLTSFMSSGPVFVAILEKDNAIDDFRRLIGATNPKEAAENTIRAHFGTSLSQNAVHGSDSIKNAKTEADFFFSKIERFCF